MNIFMRGADMKRRFVKIYLEESGFESTPELIDTIVLDAEHCAMACCFFRPLLYQMDWTEEVEGYD